MKKKVVIFLFTAVLVLALLLEFSKTYSQISKTYKNVKYANEFENLITWIKENTDENDVFFTEWELGTIVTGYTNRKAIATSKVYPSEARIVGERYKDISRFFFADNEYDAVKLMEKYNASYALVRQNFNFKVCKYINKCGPAVSLSGKIAGAPKIPAVLIVRRLLRNKNLKHFELTYSSPNFKIYKLNSYNVTLKGEKVIFDSGFYDISNAITEDFLHTPKRSLTNVQGGIVPHDILYSHKQIAEFFNSLSGNYTNIIVLGPDHYHALNDFAVTTDKDWSTPFGLLEADIDAINKLKIKRNDFFFVKEHSVRFILPFIEYRYPNAKITQILIREDFDSVKFVKLGEKIAEISNSSTLILLSLDFSHIDNVEDTKLNTKYDLQAFEIISKLNIKKVPEIESEAKAPIYTFLSAMKNMNAAKVELINISSAVHKDTKRGVGYISAVYKR